MLISRFPRLVRAAACLVLVGFVHVRPTAAQTAAELFDDSVLQTLELGIHSRDWNDLKAEYRQNTYYPADVTWNGVRVRNAGVRSRGHGSRSGTKPGLEIEFDYYAAGQRFVGLRSLVLDNLVTDGTMMHEALATAFLRRVGIAAPRESFARLVVNGEYVGLYALVESVARDFAQAHVGAPGFLFEFRWVQAFYEEFLGEALEPYMALFASRNPSGSSTQALYEPIRELFRAVNQLPNGEFSAIDRRLDLNGAVRLIAADAFLAERDGILGYDGMNNVYLYVHADRVHLIPWDKDHTFWAPDYPVLAGSEDHVLMTRILADDGLRRMFFDALDTFASAAAENGWLEATIDRYFLQIQDAVFEDRYKPGPNSEFVNAVEALRGFAQTRPAFVNAEVRRLRQGPEGP